MCFTATVISQSRSIPHILVTPTWSEPTHIYWWPRRDLNQPTDCFFVLNELQQYIWTPWSGSPIEKWSYDDLFLCHHNCTDARFGVPKSLMLMLKTQAFWVFMLSGRLLIPCVSKEHMAFILKDQGLLLEFLDPYIWRCYISLKCWKPKTLLIKLNNPGHLNP